MFPVAKYDSRVSRVLRKGDAFAVCMLCAKMYAASPSMTTRLKFSSFQMSLFCTRRKLKLRERADRFAAKVQSSQNIPEFKILLRKLYMATHPDLIRSHDNNLAEINDISIRRLNGVISTVKNIGDFPPASNEVIPFYIKTQNKNSII